jgi:cephalosporin hydroxylase
MKSGLRERIASRLIEGSDMKLATRRDMALLETVKLELLDNGLGQREKFVPHRMIGHAGFSLNRESQLAFLASLADPEIQALFNALRNDRDINTGFEGIDYRGHGLIHNGYFPTPDAELYAAMIWKTKPHRIIEVGSGYSTLIAKSTIRRLGGRCELHVIDPEPRRNVEAVADRVEYSRVECSSLASVTLTDRTLLFIDSSHVCRRGGDLPFLYCRVLPMLPAGVVIHVHDVFLPFDYPDNYVERFYTEQYLLHALLANNEKLEVLLANHYLGREHRSALQTALGQRAGEQPLFSGASFWMISR